MSNSGRLKTCIRELATAAGWNMSVELSFNPDKILAETEHVIATSDSVVLDRCRQWVNLSREIIATRLPQTWLVDLSTVSPVE